MADQFAYSRQFNTGAPWVRSLAETALVQTGVASASITYFLQNEWYKTHAGLLFPSTSLENMLYREVINNGRFIEIADVLNHFSYKFTVLKMGVPMIRYILAVPVMTPANIVTGAITLCDTKRRTTSAESIKFLETLAKSISDRLHALG